MKFLLAICLSLTLAACGGVTAKNDQQAVYKSGGTIAVALIAADTYQALNSCSKPAHTLPCSDDATVARVQDAKLKVVAAYKQADAVVNSEGYQSGGYARAQAVLQAALDFLVSITPTN